VRRLSEPVAEAEATALIENVDKRKELAMRQNRRVVTACAILMLLVPCSRSSPSSAFALDPGPPDQTLLDVKHPGGQPLWTSSLIIRSLQSVTCRWQTSAANTAYGEWQIMDYQPQPNGLNETPFASGHSPLPQADGFRQFTLDFAQLQQQHPDKIPANAPATAKAYYVRLVPWTSNTMIAGAISPAVKITYTSGRGLQPGGGTVRAALNIERSEISPNTINVFGPGLLGVFLTTSYPTSLHVRLSQSAPLLDSNLNPAFPSGTVENSVHVSSFHTRHCVGLFDLKGETHYYYIIEVTDKDGNKAYKQGDFLMGKLRSLSP